MNLFGLTPGCPGLQAWCSQRQPMLSQCWHGRLCNPHGPPASGGMWQRATTNFICNFLFPDPLQHHKFWGYSTMRDVTEPHHLGLEMPVTCPLDLPLLSQVWSILGTDIVHLVPSHLCQDGLWAQSSNSSVMPPALAISSSNADLGYNYTQWTMERSRCFLKVNIPDPGSLDLGLPGPLG